MDITPNYLGFDSPKITLSGVKEVFNYKIYEIENSNTSQFDIDRFQLLETNELFIVLGTRTQIMIPDNFGSFEYLNGFRCLNSNLEYKFLPTIYYPYQIKEHNKKNKEYKKLEKIIEIFR